MAIQFVLTDAGITELTNATGANPLNITEIAIGTGKYTASSDQSALVSETKRLTSLAGTVLSDHAISVTLKDETSDSYAVSEIGLFSETGTLFAVYSNATDFIEKTSESSLLIDVDIHFQNEDVTNLNFGDTNFSNPSASETVKGVVKLSDTDMAKEGINDATAMTPKKVVQAIQRYADTQRKNLLINGGFDVWQRDVSHTIQYGYTADRWYAECATVAATISKPSSNTLRMTKLSGETNYCAIGQRVELGTRAIAGKKMVLSFKARTSVAGEVPIVFYYNGYGDVIQKSVNMTTDWQRFEVEFDFTGITTSDDYCVPQWRLTDSQFATNDWIELQEVQLEHGEKATDFEWMHYGEIAHLCFRYFFKTKGVNHVIAGTAYRSGNDTAFFNYTLPTKMRTAPTISGEWKVSIDNSEPSIFVPNSYNVTNNVLSLGAPGSSGVSSDQDIAIYAVNIEFDAEL